MKVLIVGGGGREHALAWKIKQSPLCDKIFCMPGNPGIAAMGIECVDFLAAYTDWIAEFAFEKRIELVIIGPEKVLAQGLADKLGDISCFGPRQAGARIETSKIWSKEFMLKHGIPTAPFASFDDPDEAYEHIRKKYPNGKCVVKADGLCAGKGAIVCETALAARLAVYSIMVKHKFGAAGDYIVIEDKLSGPELSVMAITDGMRAVILPPAQDHKRLLDNNQGLNTGGMGAYSPVPIVDDILLNKIIKKILRPTLQGMAREGLMYKGLLYAGLMLVDGQPFVIEFNCRFGDPETQAVLPVIDEDILPLLVAAAQGELEGDKIIPASRAALCVVMASGGYPGDYEKGKEIFGLEQAQEFLGGNGFIFHAGTAEKEGKIITAGGRVLGVTGWGDNHKTAADLANGAAALIQFENQYYRKDIGYCIA